MTPPFDIIYEDNHLLAVLKPSGLPVQRDASRDLSLLDLLKTWLKEHYQKPGNTYLGLIHRIDRPVQGLVLLAKTDKALRRLNEALRYQKIERYYLAISENRPQKDSAQISHYLKKDSSINRSFLVESHTQGAKKAELNYRLIGSSENYHLILVQLLTGRHHQIRVQLAALGAPIRGDCKYGASRTLKGGAIELVSWNMCFQHPVGNKKKLSLTAELPHKPLWDYFNNTLQLADKSPAELLSATVD